MISQLEPWAARKVGAAGAAPSRAELERHQLRQLRLTLAWVRRRSRLYHRRLRGIPPVRSLSRLSDLPFTTAEDLRGDPGSFLCVPQGEVGRIVTLDSSGTAGPPKRLYFTAEDQILTLDYFEHGLSPLMVAGDRVLILFPGARPGSVGDLLCTTVRRLGGEPCWLDPTTVGASGLNPQVRVIIGPPLPVLALTRRRAALRPPPPRLHGILLCSDNAAPCVVDELGRTCGCQVYEAYAMTEMGLGGEVACHIHAGYHLQEPDFLFEIVDPDSGRPVPDGEPGEVVFTTLTRCGMPLIRYRTGDLSRFLVAPCPCGSRLRRLDRIRGRVGGQVRLAEACGLAMPDLDQALLGTAGIDDFTATLLPGDPPVLRVELPGTAAEAGCRERAERALRDIPAVAMACRQGALSLRVECLAATIPFTRDKRRIRIASP